MFERLKQFEVLTNITYYLKQQASSLVKTIKDAKQAAVNHHSNTVLSRVAHKNFIWSPSQTCIGDMTKQQQNNIPEEQASGTYLVTSTFSLLSIAALMQQQRIVTAPKVI